MRYKLTDIELAGNEHGQLAADTLYAKLREEDGSVSISATLDYILAAIRDRGLDVEGVEVVAPDAARKRPSSYVRLTKYPVIGKW